MRIRRTFTVTEQSGVLYRRRWIGTVAGVQRKRLGSGELKIHAELRDEQGNQDNWWKVECCCAGVLLTCNWAAIIVCGAAWDSLFPQREGWLRWTVEKL